MKLPYPHIPDVRIVALNSHCKHRMSILFRPLQPVICGLFTVLAMPETHATTKHLTGNDNFLIIQYIMPMVLTIAEESQ